MPSVVSRRFPLSSKETRFIKKPLCRPLNFWISLPAKEVSKCHLKAYTNIHTINSRHHCIIKICFLHWPNLKEWVFPKMAQPGHPGLLNGSLQYSATAGISAEQMAALWGTLDYYCRPVRRVAIKIHSQRAWTRLSSPKMAVFWMHKEGSLLPSARADGWELPEEQG